MANAPAPEQRNPPAHEVRLGLIKAAIWQNDTEAGIRYNVTFSRSYKQGDDWHSTDSFGRDDLLLLAKVADQAHSWIVEQKTSGGHAEPQAADNPTSDLAGKSLPRRQRSARTGT